MRAVRLGLVAAIAMSCRTPAAPLHPAGSDGDDGHGLLGQSSISLITDESHEEEAEPSDEDRYRDDDLEEYGRQMDDDDDSVAAFGGSAYGGTGYAGFVLRPWPVSSPRRDAGYRMESNLTGVIEGTITWRGAVPAKLTTSCGPVDALRLGANRGVSGVVVYIESVQVGRTVEDYDPHPASVGGTVVKHGCALGPSTQLVAPLPAAVEIYTDAAAAKLKVTRGTEPVVTLDMEPASHRGVSLESGYAKLEAEDGSLGAAFIVGMKSWYYSLTDDRGHFRIDELAPGTYEVTIWQAPIPKLVAGALTYGNPTVLTRKVTVGKPGAKTKPTRLDVSLGR